MGFAITAVRFPRFIAVSAAEVPAMPPPIIIMSKLSDTRRHPLPSIFIVSLPHFYCNYQSNRL